MHTHSNRYTCAHIHIPTHSGTCTCVYMHTHTCTHAHSRTHVCACTHTHTHTHTHSHRGAHTHACMHTRMRTHTHAHSNAHIHTHTRCYGQEICVNLAQEEWETLEVHMEGFQPEWYILTKHHCRDMPFWLETLDYFHDCHMFCYSDAR